MVFNWSILRGLNCIYVQIVIRNSLRLLKDIIWSGVLVYQESTSNINNCMLFFNLLPCCPYLPPSIMKESDTKQNRTSWPQMTSRVTLLNLDMILWRYWGSAVYIDQADHPKRILGDVALLLLKLHILVGQSVWFWHHALINKVS